MLSKEHRHAHWLLSYQRDWLRGDVVAGLTAAAVVIPQAMAYATIAGVSPVIGLYAAPPALILYAAFGSSRHLVTGPMAATAALSAAAVADLVAFMTWMAEPQRALRLQLGVWVLLYLAILLVLVWRLNASYWKEVK